MIIFWTEEEYKQELQQARKETVKEILEDWENWAVAGNYYTRGLSEHINNLAKQCGVEEE